MPVSNDSFYTLRLQKWVYVSLFVGVTMLKTLWICPIDRQPLLPLVIAVDSHSLRVSAQLAIGCWTDWSATSSSAAFLECEQLLSAECLIMNLWRGFDKILKMCSGEEVAKVDELAMVLILHIDHTPSILSSTDLLASNNDRFLRSYNSERNDVL